MSEYVVDFGNARIKWFNAKSGQYGDLRHAIVKLTENQWKHIVGRSKTPPAEFARVNGIPYVFGDAARRYVIPERPRGAGRYVETYYGVGIAYAIAQAALVSDTRVTLYGSYAPGDVQYARNLVIAAKQEWQVECKEGTLNLNVKRVETFDEPFGGLSHYTLTKEGVERKKNPLADKTALVIDVGGYTTDVVAVDPGGEIDLLSAKSTRTGVIDMTQGFERELRQNNAELLRTTGDIDIKRIEKAIIDGFFQAGKIKIDCSAEATAAIASLVNDVIDVINAAGGIGNFDVVLLTGGGAALIYDALVAAFPRIEFILAEPDRDLMKFANCFGGAKIFRMLKLMGAM